MTRNENHTPTAFHANIIAMDKGLLDIEDVADDYVHCTQCGACEIRCPNTLFVGDFYQARTETVKVVRAARALMVDRVGQGRLEALEPADKRTQERARARHRERPAQRPGARP